MTTRNYLFLSEEYGMQGMHHSDQIISVSASHVTRLYNSPERSECNEFEKICMEMIIKNQSQNRR